jgi:cellulose synthase/poly-beta-1,6-N-acetylglucosamine synthase-like glycosyltransferase
MIALYAHTTIGKIVSFGAMCVCMIVYIVLYLKCYLLETAYVREVVYSLGSFYVAYWHYQFYNFGHGLAKVGMIVAVVMSLGIVALTILDLVVDNARNQDWADRVFFVCATVILSCTVIAVHVAYRIRHKLRQRELPRLQ